MSDLVSRICCCIARGQSIAVATIISQQGSSPRGPGSKMVIHVDGSIDGTIGGGLVEAQTIAKARDIFSGSPSTILHFDLTGRVIGDMDLICGGQISIFLERIDPTKDNSGLYRYLGDCLKKRQRAFLVTACPLDGAAHRSPHRWVLHPDGTMHGATVLSTKTRAKILDFATRSAVPLKLNMERHLIIVEPFRSPETLYLIGAGHVSQQVATIAGMAGFRVVVLDDRPEFANRERFPHADDVRVLRSFSDVFKNQDLGPLSYVVIVTRGHLHDKEVLEQALDTSAHYIGMIGSRNKRDSIYRSLINQGISTSELERVFCPIGLDIGAQTPEEIAVSILAECVAVRSGGIASRPGENLHIPSDAVNPLAQNALHAINDSSALPNRPRA
jgi:xanthine dehydrogenase accessory factor